MTVFDTRAHAEQSAQIDEAKIPRPVGYKILCMVEERPDTFEGTQIAKAEQTKTLEEHAMQIARVIDMGPDCYKHEKYKSGPWCEIGDFILLDRYGGTKFRIGKRIFRLVDDDSVLAVVDDATLMVKLGM